MVTTLKELLALTPKERENIKRDKMLKILNEAKPAEAETIDVNTPSKPRLN